VEHAPPGRELDALPNPAGDSREFLVKMLERDPGSHVFVDLAEAFCREARWGEAVDICRKGLLLHPRITRARVLLGWALRESGQLDESITVLQKAREELEENALVYRLLAEIASSRGDAEGAARLGSLYSSLCTHVGTGSLDTHPTGELRPSETGEVPSGPGTVVAIQDPRAKQADLLAALLRRFEGKPATPAASMSILPDEARKTLKRMFRSRADS
jgi:tetratricopeptide (TPR) repeat protein